MKSKHDMTMLYEFIMLVAVISIVSLLVFQVNDDARDDIIDSDRGSTSVVNETITVLNYSVGDSLAYSTSRDVLCSITTVKNATSGLSIVSANYTSTNCLLKGTATSEYIGSDVKVDYTADYSTDTTRYNATVNSDEAVAKIPKSLKLLATAVIFGAVLYVILRVVPMRTGSTTLTQ